MRSFCCSIGVVGILLLCAPRASADILTVGYPDYPSNTKIVLDEPDATHNNNLTAYNDPAENGVQRGLAFFDVSSIPAYATVASATLTLRVDPSTGGQPSGTHSDVFRVTTPWLAAEATWNSAKTGTPWTPGGAYAGLGGGSSPYATNSDIVASPPDWPTMTWDIKTLVSEWVAGTHPNYGMELVGSAGNHLTFLDRGWGIYGLAPSLSVTYSVPEPSTVVLLGAGLLGLLVYAWRKRK